MKRYLLFLPPLLCTMAFGPPADMSTSKCDQGGCYYGMAGDDPCWEVEVKCVATPLGWDWTVGNEEEGPVYTIDCNACNLDMGNPPMVVQLQAQVQMGFSFCVSIGAGATFDGSCKVAGVGLSGSTSYNTSAQWCIDSKTTYTATVDCPCAPGNLVHCMMITRTVPIEIEALTEYNLAACYTWSPSDDDDCGGPPPMENQSVNWYCGVDTTYHEDQHINVVAVAESGDCPLP